MIDKVILLFDILEEKRDNTIMLLKLSVQNTSWFHSGGKLANAEA